MQSLTNPNSTREIQLVVNNLVRQFDNTGKVTLTANATQTVVNNGKCNPQSVITLSPIAANAAATVTTTYVVAGTGKFTVYHANNAQTDRTFGYVINGV